VRIMMISHDKNPLSIDED